MELIIGIAAIAFTLAWVGYGVQCLMNWKTRQRVIRETEPEVVENLEDWNRKWSHPDTGDFYRWEDGAYVETDKAPPRVDKSFPYYGNVVVVEEFVPNLGKSVRYVEYQGKRYTPEEFERKFG